MVFIWTGGITCLVLIAYGVGVEVGRAERRRG
jgi:hypothetical protein